jgi:hypothetical protein
MSRSIHIKIMVSLNGKSEIEHGLKRLNFTPLSITIYNILIIIIIYLKFIFITDITYLLILTITILPLKCINDIK